jgi:hypothetical protein
MTDQIRVVVVTDPEIEVATATMGPSGKISYTGLSEVIQPVIRDALKDKEDKRRAFRALMKSGWSNAYLMISLEG